MPTIDELPAAQAAADTDALPASQAGVTRQVSRAQLLAGMQPALAVPEGMLLGRSSAGVGTPEAIAPGVGLAVSGGTLALEFPGTLLSTLPGGRVPQASDIVAMSQGGADAGLSYAQFMAGLPAVPGVDASRTVAGATGGRTVRSLADWLADSVPVEAFGAVGDGQTDDSAALAAAAASGTPVRLGPRTYVVNGQWTLAADCVLLGVPGQTVLKRMAQSSGSAWISVQGAQFIAIGVIFDANRAGVPQESWGVLVGASCTASEFADCAFRNAGGATLGCGLTLLASDPAVCRHVIRGCVFSGNAAHGLWVQAVAGVQVLACQAHDNAGYGICLDYSDPAFTQKLRQAQVLGNRAWNNGRGISVGNFNAANASPTVWGTANPDVIGVLLAGNDCHDNAVYGIAVSGAAIAVQGNLCSDNGSADSPGAGILANVSASRVCGNLVTGGAPYGIDAGGSVDLDLSHNHVSGANVGINAGGSQRVRVAANFVTGCVWAVVANNVEVDGQGRNFGRSTAALAITDNWICIPGGSGGGIHLLDAPQGVVVARNQFSGLGAAAISQALWAHTDSVLVQGNLWNGQGRILCSPVAADGVQRLLVPDIADEVMVPAAPAGVQSMLTLHGQALEGHVGFVRVTNGGSGYTQASVAISGAGTGATAIAHVANGAVIGVTLLSAGSGYGAVGETAQATISGDGEGATAVVSVGLPVWEGRRLRLSCGGPVRFARAGSSPFQENWTGFDITVPADAAIEWEGSAGAWRAVQFAASDYLAPQGDGSVVLRSVSGDVILHASGSGRVRVGSDSSPAGYVTCIGHGAPEGVVVAPPGSDYRNLDGGAGATLWIKRSGDGATGWVPVA